MTETYHGPWDPVTGDRPEKVQEDSYHPRYPDAGSYKQSLKTSFESRAYKLVYKKAEGLGEKPTANADLLVVGISGSEVHG